MAATSSSRSSPTPNSRRRAVARVLGPKGLKGGVRIELLSDWPDAVKAGSRLHGESDDGSWLVTRLESGGRVPVLYLDGITTRDDADRLTGRYLEGEPRSLEPGTYFWDDLIGLRVDGPDGEEVGELVEIFRAGGNEVYRVVGAGGERLVPALRSAIERIDLAAGRIVLTADEPEEVR
jgi:16S rRNA processing protein RimM